MIGRWNIDAELKVQLVDRMAQIALTAHPRDAVNAMARLIDMDRMDMQQDMMELKQPVALEAPIYVDDEELRQGIAGLLAKPVEIEEEEMPAPLKRVFG